MAECPMLEIEAKLGSQMLKRKHLTQEALTMAYNIFMLNSNWQVNDISYNNDQEDHSNDSKNPFKFKSSINGLIAGSHVDISDPLVAQASREVYSLLLGRLNAIGQYDNPNFLSMFQKPQK